MTLLAGEDLDPAKIFSFGTGVKHGSSIDLTIGEVFDSEGKPAADPFVLKPGEIVQVVSKEIFKLPAYVTGHVTYKTTLTHKGIWALTVGIVDPGWTGPVTTTLLNFSRLDHVIHRGDEFLRVSLFEHAPVHLDDMRPAPPLGTYLKNQQKAAGSLFPKTFLDGEKVADKATSKVMNRLRLEALAWLVLIAAVLSLGQYFADFVSYRFTSSDGVSWKATEEGMAALKNEVKTLREELSHLKADHADPAPLSGSGASTAPGLPPAGR
ncbi:hypothetical protein HF265_18060 [Rhizobium leguminosarum]|uniref:dCTP deaminase domain-containing protein n=1 Tax=Rhizobium leguminosarum TaxID=384 RepID=UPI001C91653C|nr:hypothetical protein [Rhizobium leguminosarum]MBY3030982.1 hypothetical protein [Rhizobium leguminosarum]